MDAGGGRSGPFGRDSGRKTGLDFLKNDGGSGKEAWFQFAEGEFFLLLLNLNVKLCYPIAFMHNGFFNVGSEGSNEAKNRFLINIIIYINYV
jgi:hypothetical protein